MSSSPTEEKSCFDGKVSNQRNETICYAHAVANSVITALKQTSGTFIPTHVDLVNKIVSEFGTDGAKTHKVIKWICEQENGFNVNYSRVRNIKQAKEALSKNREMILTFNLTESEWRRFKNFFKNHPTSVIRNKDIYKCVR